MAEPLRAVPRPLQRRPGHPRRAGPGGPGRRRRAGPLPLLHPGGALGGGADVLPLPLHRPPHLDAHLRLAGPALRWAASLPLAPSVDRGRLRRLRAAPVRALGGEMRMTAADKRFTKEQLPGLHALGDARRGGRQVQRGPEAPVLAQQPGGAGAARHRGGDSGGRNSSPVRLPRASWVLHDVTFILFFLLIMGHIYLAIAEPGTFSAHGEGHGDQGLGAPAPSGVVPRRDR